MLKLDTNPRDPFWLDLVPGVRVKVRPISVGAMLLARAAAADALRLQSEAPAFEATVSAGAVFTRTLAKAGIIEWEGVGDAKGDPVEPSPKAIDQLLEIWTAFDAIDRLYVGPALARDDEKNA